MIVASGQPGRATVWHEVDLSPAERRRRYGSVSCSPTRPFIAGEWIAMTLRVTLGQTALRPGGRLAVAWSWPLDWTDLQTEDPGGEGYTIVSARQARPNGNGVETALRYFPQGAFDPWQHHLEMTVVRGTLETGDALEFICGDQSRGGRGWRVPTFRLRHLALVVLIDPDGTDAWHRLPPLEGLSVKPGPPVRLVVVAPGDGVVGETGTAIIRVEDRWGNATLPAQAVPNLRLVDSGPGKESLTVEDTTVSPDSPAFHATLRYTEAGVVRLRASVPGLETAALSNPIQIHATPPALRRFWGDLHSGQSEVGCGAGTMSEHFAYARDASGLQFITHQGNDHYISRDLWDLTRSQTEDFHAAGKFVTFLGCEWSAPTPDGGDRNVIYRRDTSRLRRSGRFFQEAEPDPEPDLTTAEPFLAAMKSEPVLINMHVGGRPTNLRWHAPEIERLAEIHSTHGTSEWFIRDALRRGYRFGITAGTDGITGRPGACHPGWRNNRNVRSGLTAVYARDLTRAGLWEALRARRCYATTGERIALWVEVDGHPMGAAYATSDAPAITIEIEGTAPLETVELLRGDEEIHQWRMAPAAQSHGARHPLRLLWRGTTRRGTARAQRVVWDGSLRLSGGRIGKASPLNFHGGEDGVTRIDDHQVRWRNATAGNRAGLLLEIEGDGETRCHFTAPPVHFAFPLIQVLREPLVREAGGVGCQVAVGPAPVSEAACGVRLAYRDPEPRAGTVGYWVRVTQIDQAQAWSSPVYVTRP